MKVMGLRENDIIQIFIFLNKLNIKLVVKKVSSEIEIVIYWLVDVFGLFGELFLLDVFKLYNYVVKEFENCINLVEMFYLEIFEDKKEKIVLVL